jgi:subtilisin family serine protease
MVLVVLAAGAAVYGLAGRPGLFGERLFVVMADQADLTGLDTIADRPARIQATYQRLVQHAEASQAPLRKALEGWGLHYTPYYLVNAVLVDGGPVVRRWLESRSDVDRVLLDERLRPLPVSPPTEHGAEPAPGAEPQWNINTVRAPRVWSEFGDEGKGIVIGTSDAGVDADHPDLRGSWRGGEDSWFDPWNGTTTPTAHNGHGTHTIGTALGRNGIGVAPQAQWIGCVNLDRNLGSPSRYLDCLQFMLAPFPSGGDPWRDGRADRAPHILTNSWGCPPIEGCDATALLPATAAFAAAGIYFVAAAGNSGPDCRTVTDPPAPYPDVLTVGASDGLGQMAEFSSRGPVPVRFAGDGGKLATKPDVVAPGVDILSAMPGGGYQRDSGTSMATPHVAGVVALMWSARPSLIGNIGETTRILRDTATPMPATPGTAAGCGSNANVSGSGQVDAYAAVQAARAVR